MSDNTANVKEELKQTHEEPSLIKEESEKKQDETEVLDQELAKKAEEKALGEKEELKIEDKVEVKEGLKTDNKVEEKKDLKEEEKVEEKVEEKETLKEENKLEEKAEVKESSKPEEKKASTSLEDDFEALGLTEKEALELLKEENEAKNNNKKEVKIQLYGSSVSGNMKIKKAQNKMIDTLDRFKIPYEFMDLAADDEAKLYIRRKNPSSTNIPQLYINGEFKMEYDEFEELLEYDELFDVLGVEPDF